LNLHPQTILAGAQFFNDCLELMTAANSVIMLIAIFGFFSPAVEVPAAALTYVTLLRIQDGINFRYVATLTPGRIGSRSRFTVDLRLLYWGVSEGVWRSQ
jgi:hypothetical protein